MSTEKEPLRLGELLILAALWMIFGFMLWYYLSVLHVVPARLGSEWILHKILAEDFYNIIAHPDYRYLMQVQTRIMMTFNDGTQGGLGFIINPLQYGYGLPLLFGLIMASNTSLTRKIVVLLAGYVLVIGIEIWGVVWDTLKQLAFQWGPEAQIAVAASGISENVIALCYQLGALIFPPLMPVVLWVIANWAMLDEFAQKRFLKKPK